MTKPRAMTPDEPNRKRKVVPKLRDGVMKRGATWSYVIRVKDPETGLSRPRWVGGFATENEAKAARDEARVSAYRGEYVDRNTITVGQYLDEWLEAHAVAIKPKTLKDYQNIVTRYVKPHIGLLRMQAIRPSTVTKLYRDLTKHGGKEGRALSSRTVDYVHAVLRKAFRDAVEVDEILVSSPIEKAKRPRREVGEPGTVWTTTQLKAFLRSAREHRLWTFFHLAAYTGARRGELLHLRWADVDLDGKQITITGSTAFIDGERVEGTTKSGRKRIVSLDAASVKVLRLQKKMQAADKLKAGSAWRGSTDHVFTTGWGEPIHPDTVSSLFPILIKRHNTTHPDDELPRARLHDLRHIHATTLLLAGVPVHVVAARLGHADPAITLRVYAHVVRAAEASAADVFAKAIGD
ncbi:site-specific integrase [Sinosporangium siamense]|uniref:Site-specific integrase n=1 Tax=Sinosporangium siamense TaxID=1367973 RepID=A0A919RMW4_9ACTN|nr:site-specific integrase [Sinosporangium siamense]GII95780.1 site-specific integrase [Sinosporangium siamense]